MLCAFSLCAKANSDPVRHNPSTREPVFMSEMNSWLLMEYTEISVFHKTE